MLGGQSSNWSVVVGAKFLALLPHWNQTGCPASVRILSAIPSNQLSIKTGADPAMTLCLMRVVVPSFHQPSFKHVASLVTMVTWHFVLTESICSLCSAGKIQTSMFSQLVFKDSGRFIFLKLAVILHFQQNVIGWQFDCSHVEAALVQLMF